MKNNIAEVAVDLPFEKSYNVYDYKIPVSMLDEISPGIRVIVPFSGRRREGYVVKLKSSTSVETKHILACIDDYPLFSQEMIDLACWMSEKYMCALSKTLQCMIPSGIKYKFRKKIRLVKEYQTSNLGHLQKKIVDLLKKNRGEMYYSKLLEVMEHSNVYASLKGLYEKKIIEYEKEIVSGIKPRTIKVVEPVEGLPDDIVKKLSKKLQEVLQIIRTAGGISIRQIADSLDENYSTVYSRVKKLMDKKLVKYNYMEVFRNPASCIAEAGVVSPFTLTEEQENVLKLIRRVLNSKGKKKGILVHGVTGSGKTEVYLRAVEMVLQQKKGAIVLVPEISLTSQMIKDFVRRFGKRVALLHSKLSKGERFDEWRKIKQGKADIVLGTRSAVFAPMDNIGIIIIDEEHENTYKQEENPKYHAREVAEKRCADNNALLVLGSATPSIETYYRAQKGYYHLVEMKKRIKNRPLPPVEIVDMRQELKEGNKSIFSRSLYRAMVETLDRGDQVILFLNRRGFSTFVLCRECGLVLKCPQCDISLTFHFDSNMLKCHYCGYFEKTPDICPNCSSIYIRFFGIGTQKVEQLVKRLFRGAVVHRMDVDSTTRKGSHESILNRFNNGDIDVLIGTQMVAKGLDNPRVGLVGVITADTSLNLPDFRAGERTFQLATQVAGRTGRGQRPGRVILQTYNPEHYALKYAAEHNYLAFYKKEINLRKQFKYPPFCSLVNIIFSGSDENNTARRAQTFAQSIFEVLPKSWALLGPSPAPISKIKGNFRWQVILKGEDINKIIPLLTSKYFRYKNENDDVKISVDLNPYFML